MRIRFRFSKVGKVRFTSQRDAARMWERALRRARLPLAYTAGFSPRPQVSFGFALPTGCESIAEYLDVVVDDERATGLVVAELPEQLTPLLPDGLTVTEAAVVDGKIGSLQQQVASCSWVMLFSGVSSTALGERAEALLAAPVVPIRRERKGREVDDDLRPSVMTLSVTETAAPALAAAGVAFGEGVQLVAELATQPRGVRPPELLRGLMAVGGTGGGADHRFGSDWDGRVPSLDRACRTQQWIVRDGLRSEPLELQGLAEGADRAMHAWERAS